MYEVVTGKLEVNFNVKIEDCGRLFGDYICQEK